MTSRLSVSQVVDVNIHEQGLGILDAQAAYRQQFSEAKDASEVLDILESMIADDEEAWTPYAIAEFAMTLPRNIRELLDYASSDAHVVVDVFDPSMTRFDSGQVGDSDRITGFIRVPGDLHPLYSPKPGEAGSIYKSTSEWLMDFVTTVLTGIHPEHGDDFPLDKDYAHSIVNRYKKRLRTLIGDMPIKDFRALIDAMPDRPVEDESHISPYVHRNRFSHLLPPPHPDDETKPGAVTPRPGFAPGESSITTAWVKIPKRGRRRASSGMRTLRSSMPYAPIWLNPGPDSEEQEFTELVRSAPVPGTPEHDRMMLLNEALRLKADRAARRSRLLTIVGNALDELWGTRVQLEQSKAKDEDDGPSPETTALRELLCSLVATIRGFDIPEGTLAAKAKRVRKTRRKARRAYR
jgi:hypothetical protein